MQNENIAELSANKEHYTIEDFLDDNNETIFARCLQKMIRSATSPSVVGFTAIG